MFHVTIKDTYDEVSKEAFKIMKSVLDGDHTPVLGLATGSSPVGLYQEMIKDHKENGTSYKDILTFNLDEYIGLPRDHRESYWTFMHQNLFNYIDIPDENVHVPLGCGEDPEADCRAYEDRRRHHPGAHQSRYHGPCEHHESKEDNNDRHRREQGRRHKGHDEGSHDRRLPRFHTAGSPRGLRVPRQGSRKQAVRTGNKIPPHL